jgi:hypothetical protein
MNDRVPLKRCHPVLDRRRTTDENWQQNDDTHLTITYSGRRRRDTAECTTLVFED